MTNAIPSADQSHLDSKYFLTADKYNCPCCNRRHVTYHTLGSHSFDWSNSKICTVWRVQCRSWRKTSMHLTFEDVAARDSSGARVARFQVDVDLDSAFFYSVPTSFFVVDQRIPRVIRELITEAEGCAKMNHLTGASACTREAIYTLLALQGAQGANYDDKIKDLASKHPGIDPELFETLGHIKTMTSDHVHEDSWIAWDSKSLKLFLEALKAVLHEMYVVPDEKKARAAAVRALRGEFGKAKGPETTVSDTNEKE